jgi:hypothetical protein
MCRNRGSRKIIEGKIMEKNKRHFAHMVQKRGLAPSQSAANAGISVSLARCLSPFLKHAILPVWFKNGDWLRANQRPTLELTIPCEVPVPLFEPCLFARIILPSRRFWISPSVKSAFNWTAHLLVRQAFQPDLFAWFQ